MEKYKTELEIRALKNITQPTTSTGKPKYCCGEMHWNLDYMRTLNLHIKYSKASIIFFLYKDIFLKKRISLQQYLGLPVPVVVSMILVGILIPISVLYFSKYNNGF